MRELPRSFPCDRVGQDHRRTVSYLKTFDEVARKILHCRPFPKTRVGREFKRQGREIFDRMGTQ
jgi:hypothetical protein